MRLLLCDDHALLLEALAVALTARGHDVVATVTDPGAVAEVAERCAPDVCILDIAFPSGDGLEAAREIADRSPATKVLILSATSDPALVRAAFEAGALGFVQKDESVEEILSALRRLGDGEIAIDPQLLRLAMRVPRPAPSDSGRMTDALRLTPRETQVLVHLVAGDTTAEIGRSLGVASSTARTHIQNVLIKLGVHSRLQATAFAVSHHLVDESALGARWPIEQQVRRA
jgi:two-component system nitrate/nitrite response regulator NarL